MKLPILFLALAMAITTEASNKLQHHIEHERIEDKTFGSLFVYKPMPPFKNFVIFASGNYGWASPASDMARALAEEGNLVIGFSTPAYMKNAMVKKNCVQAAKDFLALAGFLRGRFALDSSRKPLLYGFSTGATLAFATTLQQTSPIFQATVGMAFCPDLKEADQFCKMGSLAIANASDGFESKRMLTIAKEPLTSFYALNGEKDKFCKATATSEFVKSLNQNKIELQMIPDTDHFFQTEKKWKTHFLKLLERVSRQ